MAGCTRATNSAASWLARAAAGLLKGVWLGLPGNLPGIGGGAGQVGCAGLLVHSGVRWLLVPQ